MPANDTAEQRLAALGLTLPKAAAPVANYSAFRITGTLLVISGQLPLGAEGALDARHKGKLGASVSAQTGAEAARLCALNVLAQAKAALGTLERVAGVVRLGGFIAASPEFTALATVMNGASDVMVAAFGEAGKHARSTIGVPVLPLDGAVEVEALFEISP